MCGPLGLLPSFHPPPVPLARPCPLTADLNALLFSEEVVLLSITATIYKVLTVPSLGIVKAFDSGVMQGPENLRSRQKAGLEVAETGVK